MFLNQEKTSLLLMRWRKVFPLIKQRSTQTFALLFALSLSLSLVLSSCSANTAVISAYLPTFSIGQDQEKVVRIGHQKFGSLSLLRAKGDLEKRLNSLGLSVRWNQFPSGPPLLEALNALNYSTNISSATNNSVAPAESHKTEQTVAQATTEVAEEMAPEKIVVDEPPPEPDYPSYRIQPGKPIILANFDPNAAEQYRKKKHVEKELEKQRQRLQNLQERFYADRRRSLLIVLQAMDTGGKDGVIKHVFGGLNPQGCQVWSFKSPAMRN